MPRALAAREQVAAADDHADLDATADFASLATWVAKMVDPKRLLAHEGFPESLRRTRE